MLRFNHRKARWLHELAIAMCLLILAKADSKFSLLQHALVEETMRTQLDGIGYYEDTALMGIAKSSLAGGCEIVFYGEGMSHDPSSISAIFASTQLGASNVGPPTPCKAHPHLIACARGHCL